MACKACNESTAPSRFERCRPTNHMSNRAQQVKREKQKVETSTYQKEDARMTVAAGDVGAQKHDRARRAACCHGLRIGRREAEEFSVGIGRAFRSEAVSPWMIMPSTVNSDCRKPCTRYVFTKNDPREKGKEQNV